MPPLCEWILGLKVEAVQGKQVSLEWTEKSGGLWEWWHEGQPCGKASWKASCESLEGKAQIPDAREGKSDTAATAREEIARACPHSRRGLPPLGILQNYPKIHVSTGEESSGSGTDST